jgi:tetratricopeptide (TPR) repeat protein
VVVAAAAVASLGFRLFDSLYVLIAATAGYLYVKYRISSPLQLFSTKFNLLVDYDLDVEGALAMCKEHLEHAPTKGVEELYRWYYGMAHYYSGHYQEAIQTLNQVELKRMNAIYQVMIFVFIAYAAYEIEDMETFRLQMERIEGSKARVPAKYQSFIDNYTEILHALSNRDQALDSYKATIEKHFSREDGYISTKLIFHYRMAAYFEALGDTVEKDKCLAFVIANGKNHHTALQAKKRFTDSVRIEDFVFDPTAPAQVEGEQPSIETAGPLDAEEPLSEESSDKE